MDLQYDSTHLMLRESAQRLLRDRHDHRMFQTIAASEHGWSPALWAAFAEMGWLGLPFAEDDGGSGGGAIEIAVLMEEFGRALVVEPFLPTVVLGGGLVAALGTTAQRQAILPAVAAGTLRLALAYDEKNVAITAQPRDNEYILAGEIEAVLGAPQAETLLVAARLPSGTAGVFIVPAGTRGLVVRPHRTVDGARAADLTLADVTLPPTALLGGTADAGDALARVLQHAVAAVSADAVGAIQAMVAATVDYTKARVQFGQPIAKFQVIQHRLVEMKVREEEARASCLLATLSLDGPPAQRIRAVSGAKAKIGRCARAVAQEAVQLHGAIGTTNELSLGAYAKRLMAYEIRFGSTREHLRRYAAVIADPALAGAGLLLDSA